MADNVCLVTSLLDAAPELLLPAAAEAPWRLVRRRRGRAVCVT
jgi:hypothetical protein